MDRKLTLPPAEDLTTEDGWIQLQRYLYFTPRLHLHLEHSQTQDFAVGDILRTYHTTQFAETEVVESFEQEFSTVDVTETTRSAALSNDLSRRLSAAINAAAKAPFYEASANLGASLEEVVRTSISEALRTSETVTRREKKTFTVTQTIRPGASEYQYAVAGYRRYRQDVYLHYIDYLFVEYRTSLLGLRKRKRNLPRPVEGVHVNRIPLNLPLFRLHYWDLEEESSLLFTETEYRSLTKAAHPDRVTFEPLTQPMRLPMPARAELPTLYTLSNIAFPLRWVDRPGPWTREELEQIEMDEAEGSAWWYEYGPGRDSK